LSPEGIGRGKLSEGRLEEMLFFKAFSFEILELLKPPEPLFLKAILENLNSHHCSKGFFLEKILLIKFRANRRKKIKKMNFQASLRKIRKNF